MGIINADFTPFAEKMYQENLPEIAIRTFKHYYNQLVEGKTGLISENNIAPVTNLPDSETFPDSLRKTGEKYLSRTVLLKLNGGLGTGMGLSKAKSLLKIREGLSFLDIIAHQSLRSGNPLVLMNSFSTRSDSLKALKNYPGLTSTIPLDFMQHKVPKVTKSDFSPVSWPAAPDLEWCPPGHGDIYTALVTTGMMDKLLEADVEYAFISNADNLGAVMDTALLGYFVEKKLPFMMEAADRTPADRKGGHLACLPNGQLILREVAQCPKNEIDIFQDIDRYKYFNTNSIWINLKSLKYIMEANKNILGIAMIRNKKTVDPRDSKSTPVYQLETAMGAAIAIFNDASAVRVPRTRFAPVKTTSDLLSVQSDDYILTKDFYVIPNPKSLTTAMVTLDPITYKIIDNLEKAFPYGPPSLIECEAFQITGKFQFGKNIIARGDVRLHNPGTQTIIVRDDTILDESWTPKCG